MGTAMNRERNACTIATANIGRGVDANSRFPQNVFIGEWLDFFFFDSDWMRDAEFVDQARAFLEAERGACACLRNLDLSVTTATANTHQLLIHESTASSEYRLLLKGRSLGSGWLDGIERLACASDSGEWCMYCEPANEIAVIAFRRQESVQRYRVPMSAFHAVRIEEAIGGPLSYGFSESVLSTQWRTDLLLAYAPRES